ncbi:hypothetical protein QT969_10455 [Rhodococcus sp. CSLK01-03]|uniref:Uncharacterized protein n=1 Tax=Rhodococcus indonesiensis TaxID=3055869 RepID=A0ABT7RM65_9NOCA|nr:hypothetical protein [Rhodococcus indonesiensis]MDM7488712.1 hypothetical protein [Rhodococcus indonesiensis]
MKLVFNPEALYEVRRMPAVQAEVENHAARIATAAGAGYAWSSQQGQKRPQGRWRAIVYPDTWAARRDNAANNTLLRNLGGGAA